MSKTVNIVGISRDHSGSMSSIARHAARDFNDNIAAFSEASAAQGQETRVTIVECGYGSTRDSRLMEQNVPVTKVANIPENAYSSHGRGTPLFDSVGLLIETLEQAPVQDDEDVSYVVMIVTDGEENSSVRWTGLKIAQKIKELQATDLWTFVFRVPNDHEKRHLIGFGIPADNILVWAQTQKGVETASAATREAITQFYSARSAGATSTKTFYANLKDVTSADVEKALEDISGEINIWPISPKDDGSQIRPFVESRLNGNPMLKGAAFYQLTVRKEGHEVQDYKKVLIRDKTTKAVYFGDAARKLAGIPTDRTVTLRPDALGNFELFVQSTSVNRKLTSGSELIYWPNVGVKYKEGPSAR